VSCIVSASMSCATLPGTGCILPRYSRDRTVADRGSALFISNLYQLVIPGTKHAAVVTFLFIASLRRVLRGTMTPRHTAQQRTTQEIRVTVSFQSSRLSGSRATQLVARTRTRPNARITAVLSSLCVGGLVSSLAFAEGTPPAKAPLSPAAMAIHQHAIRPQAKTPATVDSATVETLSSTLNTAQGPGPGAIGPGPGCNLFPAPASVGASVPLSYFGPSPSTTNPSLVGPVQLLKSGTVDAKSGTITLPLYKGRLAGSNKTIWYILTDVDDSNVADELGLNFSTKLTFAANASRSGTLDADGNIVFDKGTVNFAPKRSIVPGPAGAEFPPKSFAPGSIGDADYSPFVRIANAGNVIYNAPMVAFNVSAQEINFPNGNVDYSKVHDQVVAIDPVNMTVTINLINGFSFGRPVWYISMDASSALPAAIEHNTLAPLMAFVMRDIEMLSIAETAEVLQISEALVKTRLLRARLRMRRALAPGFG
jgi:Sigma-70, region 4